MCSIAHSADSTSVLIASLMQPEVYDYQVESIQLVETHISWVILTGSYVFKIKKPVNLGFLDFSTLEKRLYYCEEEVRLNSRIAADIYLQVMPITGSPEQPRWGGSGRVIEYAVKMRQFPQEGELDRILDRGELEPYQIGAFAHTVADFHSDVDVASNEDVHGTLESIYQPVKENFSQIKEHVNDKALLKKLHELQHWSHVSFERLQPVFEKRKIDGFIRECHGDMHLRNMAWVNDKPLVFDCIEFSANLRWIDVICEIAFLLMDLQKYGQLRLAQRFLNCYLERTGDYGGVRVLAFYLIYRALVRAKIEAIRAGQSNISEEVRTEGITACRQYLQLAQYFTETDKPRIIITHGLSASGKSRVAQALVENLRAIRIRSDVERKRLFGLQSEESGKADINQEIYSPETGLRTYNKLVELAGYVLEGGFTVIIDAANLKWEQRQCFQVLAKEKQVPYLILDITASEGTLRRRIEQRNHGASDARIEVLEHQLQLDTALKPEEKHYVVRVDTEVPLDIEHLIEKIKSVV